MSANRHIQTLRRLRNRLLDSVGKMEAGAKCESCSIPRELRRSINSLSVYCRDLVRHANAFVKKYKEEFATKFFHWVRLSFGFNSFTNYHTRLSNCQQWADVIIQTMAIWLLSAEARAIVNNRNISAQTIIPGAREVKCWAHLPRRFTRQKIEQELAKSQCLNELREDLEETQIQYVNSARNRREMTSNGIDITRLEILVSRILHRDNAPSPRESFSSTQSPPNITQIRDLRHNRRVDSPFQVSSSSQQQAPQTLVTMGDHRHYADQQNEPNARNWARRHPSEPRHLFPNEDTQYNSFDEQCIPAAQFVTRTTRIVDLHVREERLRQAANDIRTDDTNRRSQQLPQTYAENTTTEEIRTKRRGRELRRVKPIKSHLSPSHTSDIEGSNHQFPLARGTLSADIQNPAVSRELQHDVRDAPQSSPPPRLVFNWSDDRNSRIDNCQAGQKVRSRGNPAADLHEDIMIHSPRFPVRDSTTTDDPSLQKTHHEQQPSRRQSRPRRGSSFSRDVDSDFDSNSRHHTTTVHEVSPPRRVHLNKDNQRRRGYPERNEDVTRFRPTQVGQYFDGGIPSKASQNVRTGDISISSMRMRDESANKNALLLSNDGLEQPRTSQTSRNLSSLGRDSGLGWSSGSEYSNFPSEHARGQSVHRKPTYYPPSAYNLDRQQRGKRAGSSGSRDSGVGLSSDTRSQR